MISDPLVRQSRSNALHWLQANGFPEVFLYHEQSDRCLFICDTPITERCNELMDEWDCHIKAHQPLGFKTAFCGWRERRARWAAQIIEHHGDAIFYELDFDGSNPAYGLAPAAWHLIADVGWQKLTGRKTDPRKVAKARGWPLILEDHDG